MLSYVIIFFIKHLFRFQNILFYFHFQCSDCGLGTSTIDNMRWLGNWHWRFALHYRVCPVPGPRICCTAPDFQCMRFSKSRQVWKLCKRGSSRERRKCRCLQGRHICLLFLFKMLLKNALALSCNHICLHPTV